MIVWACIAPHGGELIPELAGNELPRMAATRASMIELGTACRAHQPDTIVVFTPHGFVIEDHISLGITPYANGHLDGEGGARVSASFETDREFAYTLTEELGALDIPAAHLAADDDGEVAEVLPLDWGALIPLWFLAGQEEPLPRVVILCPSRDLSREQLMGIGEAVRKSAEIVGRRVAIACSADQGHGHSVDGPYGYTPGSADFDKVYCETVAANELDHLLAWEEDWIDEALTDSYWQTLMLYGALNGQGFQSRLLSYEAPTYFGMACAEFTRPENHI